MKSGTDAVLGARVSTSGVLGGAVVRIWQALAVLFFVALTWWYLAERRLPSSNGHRTLVIALGWIGTTLAVFATALSIRKRLAYQGIGKMAGWMRAHTYLGGLAAFAIFYHADFRAGGPLTAVLLGFFSLTVATGLLGWWIARTLPPLLTAIEEKPAIMEEVRTIRADCLRGMLELAAAGSADFQELVKHRLMKETTSWTRMFRFFRKRSTLDDELPAFLQEQSPAQSSLQPSEHLTYRRAAEYALRINKMNAELFLQRTLRGWITFHVAATTGMFALAAIHIVSVLYF